MTALAAVQFALKHRSKALGGVVVALLVVIWTMNGRIQTLTVALAAKPKVVTKIKTEVKIREVKGPERVVEKIIVRPGGERIISRVIYKDRIVKETGTQTARESTEDPVAAMEALKHRPKHWLVGVSAQPFGGGRLSMARAGVTVWDRFDLTYAYEFRGPGAERHRAEIALRF